jgi:hypothetical protein
VVVVNFDGGTISSDSGGLLLREVEQRTHILKRLAGCFVDYRDADQIARKLESLIKQRVMGLALGYEDLNDHDALRQDRPLRPGDPAGGEGALRIGAVPWRARARSTAWSCPPGMPMRGAATRRL